MKKDVPRIFHVIDHYALLYKEDCGMTSRVQNPLILSVFNVRYFQCHVAPKIYLPSQQCQQWSNMNQF